MKVHRGFECHPLRQRIPEVDKSGLPLAKSPRRRRFLSRDSLRERPASADPPRFWPFLSISTFRGDFANVFELTESERKERLLARVPFRFEWLRSESKSSQSSNSVTSASPEQELRRPQLIVTTTFPLARPRST